MSIISRSLTSFAFALFVGVACGPTDTALVPDPDAPADAARADLSADSSLGDLATDVPSRDDGAPLDPSHAGDPDNASIVARRTPPPDPDEHPQPVVLDASSPGELVGDSGFTTYYDARVDRAPPPDAPPPDAPVVDAPAPCASPCCCPLGQEFVRGRCVGMLDFSPPAPPEVSRNRCSADCQCLTQTRTSSRCDFHRGCVNTDDRVWCDTRFVDTANDRTNCGFCGNVCPGGLACVAGGCTDACPSGQARCGGRCVDTSADAANCGACGAACAAGQRCLGGRCVASCASSCDCPLGLSCNYGACTREVDFSPLPPEALRRNRCADSCQCERVVGRGSACDRSIPGGPLCTCPNGRWCDGRCVDTAGDRANCGYCGNVCPAGLACVAGRCTDACPAGQARCGGRCVDTSADAANCGACGVACGPWSACVAGGCVCNPPNHGDCDGNRANGCETPFDDDPANCGACGRACPGTLSCSFGDCVCAVGTARCGDRCVVTSRDPANCGACGRACAAGQPCVDGRCVPPACPAGTARCGDACVDTLVSDAHCGACGLACDAGETCTRGVCRASAAPPRDPTPREPPGEREIL